MEIVDKILEWPVIIQGMVGSFLFWILFKIGEKALGFASGKIKAEKKLGGVFGRHARDDYYMGRFEASNYSFFLCLYGAIHYFLKFAFVVFISEIVKDFVPVFAYVGYIFAVYFIFRSISYVTHFDVFESEDKRLGREHPGLDAVKAANAAVKAANAAVKAANAAGQKKKGQG